MPWSDGAASASIFITSIVPIETALRPEPSENGLRSAKGDFIAIFDADFVPEPDFLQKAIHYFTDPKIGMVQGRWEHLNREYSFLTRTQAIFLDGHFMLGEFYALRESAASLISTEQRE